MSAKIRKITVFFMFFKIEMTFILESMGLHTNKIFHQLRIREKIFNLPRVVFEILDFQAGRTKNFQKMR